MTAFRRLAAPLALLVFSLASGLSGAATAAPTLQTAYVLLGEDGARIARAVTTAATCPTLRLDGRSLAMKVRAAPGALPVRPTISKPELTKASTFPATVCEATIPAGATHAALAGAPLPLPPARVDRIVVIGDTGCRLKESEKAVQACNDPRAYPFAAIAAHAAAWKPDLVIHVGDYLYRETPCPEGEAGCKDSPWGYGWDAWNADLFAPAASLLRAAPWVMTRGNHENCARGGQGWWRLLDVRPLKDGRDCVDPVHDADNDYSPPYAVPLGDGAQVVAMDLAGGPDKPLKPEDPRTAQYDAAYTALDAFSRKARFTFMATHKPILGFGGTTKEGPVTLTPGARAIQSAFLARNPNLLPDGVDVLLAGHIHLWEQVSFSSPHPSQFITGFSGTLEDVPTLPATLPPGARPAPGAIPDQYSVWTGGFGYMTLERQAPDHWRAVVWNADGQPVRRCEIVGRHSKCED